MSESVLVGVIMGSRSDWPTMEHACAALDDVGVPYEVRVVSAHRTPELLFDYASTARARGLLTIVAGAGGAAHLPGMVAAKTTLPVLGVPWQSKALSGLDSLLSIAQMPRWRSGGHPRHRPERRQKCRLLAAAIVAGAHPEYVTVLERLRQEQTDAVLARPDPRRPS